MSSAEVHRTGAPKHLCQRCRDRRARLRCRGGVCADRDPALCFECYRGEVNSARARRLTETAVQPPEPSPFARQEAALGRVLDERQLAHRQRMLDHLQRKSPVAS